MDQQNAQCSHNVKETEILLQHDCKDKSESVISIEMTTNLHSDFDNESLNIPPPKCFTFGSSYFYGNNDKIALSPKTNCSVPLTIISRQPSVVVAHQPQMPSNLPSPVSLVPGHVQPQSLLQQALEKLHENSHSTRITNHFRNIHIVADQTGRYKIVDRTEIPPPDSPDSAPPSYSFVLRQMAIRRRPRIVGTFIPSPSFIQHTPPPNYTAAFDIYVDSPMPPTPRVYSFGFASVPAVCPNCGHTGMTEITSKVTLCTHLCAVILCVLFCWVCAPLPYILRSCKDVYHYCRNCRHLLGIYCPTNPENTFN